MGWELHLHRRQPEPAPADRGAAAEDASFVRILAGSFVFHLLFVATIQVAAPPTLASPEAPRFALARPPAAQHESRAISPEPQQPLA